MSTNAQLLASRTRHFADKRTAPFDCDYIRGYMSGISGASPNLSSSKELRSATQNIHTETLMLNVNANVNVNVATTVPVLVVC